LKIFQKSCIIVITNQVVGIGMIIL